jgi:signal transduction histidine kinase
VEAPAAVEVACYRIAQEALTNVARHAQARSTMLRLAPDESCRMMTLKIADDGGGLPVQSHTGVGLSSMRERAEELGGGVRVYARLPLVS